MSDPQVPLKSQKYLSTRGGIYGLSFETVVLKGLAADGGLFLPEEVPVTKTWSSWKDLSYSQLAFEIFSLYISTDDIPSDDLKAIIDRSYSTFRANDITPLRHLQGNLYLLELFHGPSYSFKDCALQFVGNLFEYFLSRMNYSRTGKDRYHLTVIGATSGDTGSAAIYGLRGKTDISVYILHPKGRVSPIQEAQMTTVLDRNVHNLAVEGTFDDCQDIVKALFGDPSANQTLKLGAVNSINWARILAQIAYYFYAYFSLVRASSSFNIGDNIRVVTPTGNFGNILAGYLAKKMGLPADKLIVATNENDILDRFWKTGRYEKHPADGDELQVGPQALGSVSARRDGSKETHSPAMDILVSSNFERLMWFLSKEHASLDGTDDQLSKKLAGQQVSAWFQSFKATGSFGPVPQSILESARRTFATERVSDPDTLKTIQSCYEHTGYVLDPHSAVGIAAAKRSMAQYSLPHISLATAHPAKFSGAVNLALKGIPAFNFEEQVLPPEFVTLAHAKKRVTTIENSWERVRDFITKQTEEDSQDSS